MKQLTGSDARIDDSLPLLRTLLCDLAGQSLPSGGPAAARLWRHRSEPLAIAGAPSANTLFLSGLGPARLAWQARLPWPVRGLLWRDFGSGQAVPADAVLLAARRKLTGTLLSAGAGAVIKLSIGPDAAMAARELARLNDPRLTETRLAPRVLACGEEADRAWGVQEFCTLDRAVDAALLIDSVLPRLFSYWAAVGVEPDSARAQAGRIAEGVDRLGLRAALAPALARLDALGTEAGDFAFPKVMTHGDLQPRHLMRGRDGRTVLIDWDTSRPRAFMADAQRLAPAVALFQPGDAALRGPMKAVAEAMVAWANTVGGEIRTPAQMTGLLLGTLLERIIEIAEVRGIPLRHQQRSLDTLAALGLSPPAVALAAGYEVVAEPAAS